MVDAVSQQTYFIVFGSPFNPTLGMVEKNVLMGRACLTFWKKMVYLNPLSGVELNPLSEVELLTLSHHIKDSYIILKFWG